MTLVLEISLPLRIVPFFFKRIIHSFDWKTERVFVWGTCPYMHIVLFVLSQICAEKTARKFAKICSTISTCRKVSGVSIFHFLPVLLGLFVTHVGRRDVEMLKKACHDVEMLGFQKSRSGNLGMTQHFQRTGTGPSFLRFSYSHEN